MVIELRVVQFWSEIILVISNQTRAARSFDFEITRMISDQIALHSVQLPILTLDYKRYTQTKFLTCCSKVTDRSSSIPVIVSFDVPGQDFASKYFPIFKCSHVMGVQQSACC